MASAGTDTDTDTMVVHTYGSPGVGSVNSHWIESATGVVVIDGQRQVSEARHVLGEIAKTGKPVEALVITHHHPDHIGGTAAFATAFPDARVLAGPATIDSIRHDEGGLIALCRQWFGGDFAVAERLVPLPQDQRVTLAGLSFEVRQAGPGEASSMSLLYFRQARALFAADVVSNAMTPYLVEQRTGAWLTQLEWLMHEFPGSCMAYPGHGAPAPLHALVASTRACLMTVRDLVAEAQRGTATLTPGLRHAIVDAIEGRFPRYVPVAAIPDAVGLNVDGVWAELQRLREPAVAPAHDAPTVAAPRDTPGKA